LLSPLELTAALQTALGRPLPSLFPHRTALAELALDSLDVVAIAQMVGTLVPGFVVPTSNGLIDLSWTVGELHHLLCAWEERASVASEWSGRDSAVPRRSEAAE
jgi:hypothetical protein